MILFLISNALVLLASAFLTGVFLDRTQTISASKLVGWVQIHGVQLAMLALYLAFGKSHFAKRGLATLLLLSLTSLMALVAGFIVCDGAVVDFSAIRVRRSIAKDVVPPLVLGWAFSLTRMSNGEGRDTDDVRGTLTLIDLLLATTLIAVIVSLILAADMGPKFWAWEFAQFGAGFMAVACIWGIVFDVFNRPSLYAILGCTVLAYCCSHTDWGAIHMMIDTTFFYVVAVIVVVVLRSFGIAFSVKGK